MKLWAFTSEEINCYKCGECNWEASTFYWLAETREEALEEIKKIIEEDDGAPLCGSCMTDMLFMENFNISK